MTTRSSSWLWKLANSQVGVVVIGFVLATVLGSLLTGQIERVATEHKIRFSRLHEDRAVAIRDLHGKIVDVEESLRNLYYKYRPIGIAPVFPDETDVAGSIRVLRTQFEKSRIYLSPELCTRLDAVCNGFEEAFRELEAAYVRQPPGRKPGVAPDFVETRFMEYFERSRSARRDLEAEFRKVIGSV